MTPRRARRSDSRSESHGERGNPLTRWRRRRRVMRETRLLLKEARRLLRKHRVRLKDELAREVDEALAALVGARAERDWSLARQRAEKLDELLEKHLSFGRKSALREYAESIGIAVAIALVLRAFVVEAFKIPSGSMIPTLKVGDHIFVNKFIYGLRIPWTDIKFFERRPARGSVVVFVYPEDEDKDFIKRVVAVGGDTIEVRDSVVHVNGQPVARWRVAGQCRYVDGDEDSKRPCQPDRPLEEQMPCWRVRPCVAFDEDLGGHRYRVIQDVGFERDSIDFGPTRIPEGQVFVMGDNRDNSSDSRVWGTVPLSYIKGRALIVWWSSGRPDGVRWGRFFDSVHAAPAGPDVDP